MEDLKIYSLQDSIRVEKENQTEVHYYIFDEFEIHLNKIAPHSSQEWHCHRQIEECILVTKGTLNCLWIENNERKSQDIQPNEIVRVNQSIHTFENHTDEIVEFIVYRMVPDGQDKREIIKTDKTLMDPLY